MDAQATFKDRSFGLMFFGVFLMVLGLGCIALVPLAIVGMLVNQNMPGGYPLSAFTLASTIVFYGGLGLAFIALGIGTWLKRRWACRLTLALSAAWLAVGVLGMINWLVMLPYYGDFMRGMMETVPTGADMPEGMIGFLTVVTTIVHGTIMLLLPLILLLFFRGPNVQATCNWYDPRPRWTDPIAVPVLMLSIMWIVASGSMLSFVFAMGPFPVMGQILTGWPAAACALAGAILGLVLAWGLTTQRMGWWWALLATSVVLTLNAAASFSPDFLTQLYLDMGMPQEQVDAFMRLVAQLPILWMMAIPTIAYFGFLLWVRRYFNPAPASGAV
jgi:hypothetical protein